MLKSKTKASLTEGPILTRMLLFVFPLILTGVLQVMYNMADNIVVGQFSGDPDALAAVGSTASLTTLIINFLIGIASGAGVVIAQGEERRAQKAQRQQHHAHRDDQLPPVQALKLCLESFFHALAPFSAPRSSNL